MLLRQSCSEVRTSAALQQLPSNSIQRYLLDRAVKVLFTVFEGSSTLHFLFSSYFFMLNCAYSINKLAALYYSRSAKENIRYFSVTYRIADYSLFIFEHLPQKRKKENILAYITEVLHQLRRKDRQHTCPRLVDQLFQSFTFNNNNNTKYFCLIFFCCCI